MSKTWIGIDNGKQGGICVVNADNKVVDKMVMPVIGKDYDVAAIAEFLKRYDPVMVVLEKVMVLGGKTSKVGAMSSGRCLGMLEGICAALQYPYEIVAPKTWQKTVFKGMSYKDTKTASIHFAKRMCPKESWKKSDRATKDHDGLTDGFCLAMYGKMKY